jgi:ABC-2 type transport system ATP-binding protein
VKGATVLEEGEWTTFALGVGPGADPREAIYRAAIERNWALRELSRERVTLEDVFADITHPDE